MYCLICILTEFFNSDWICLIKLETHVAEQTIYYSNEYYQNIEPFITLILRIPHTLVTLPLTVENHHTLLTGNVPTSWYGVVNEDILWH